MADLADVMDALTTTALNACYPNTTSQPSVTTRPIDIAEGWPKAADVDAAIKASPARTLVTVFAVPGASGDVGQVFDDPGVIVAPVHGITPAISGSAVTLAGTPGVGEYLTVILDGLKVFSRAAVLNDTAAIVATAMAALIAVNYAGTAAVGSVINIVGAHAITVRVGAAATMGQIIHRQKQLIRITVWAPSPADRTAVARAVDVAVKRGLRIPMPDTSNAIITYQSTLMDDGSQNVGEYRRDLVYTAQYDTVDQFAAYEVTSIPLTIDSGSGATKTPVY